jgi:hypothetical protein
MPGRRDFVRSFARATAGAYVMSRAFDGPLSAPQMPAARREVTVGGRGTDVPFNWPVTVDLVLNATFLSDSDKVAILGGNLQKLLRLDS